MMKLIRERFAPGEAFVAADFRDVGSRAMLNQALSRLARSGRIARLGAGLYYVAGKDTLIPRAAEIVNALRRKSRSRYALAAPRLANNYGLSEQVPVRDEYLTDGRSRCMPIGKRLVYFKRASKATMNRMESLPGRVVIALRYLGRRTSKTDARFSLSLMPPDIRRDLRNYAPNAPKWMRPIMQDLP